MKRINNILGGYMKYRLWDKEKKQYHDFDKPVNGISEGVLFIDNEGLVMSAEIGGIRDVSKRYEVEYSPGFKDPDNQYIFENDLLDDNGYGRLKVFFYDGWFGVQHIDPEGHLSGDDLTCHYEGKKIIGTIHD